MTTMPDQTRRDDVTDLLHGIEVPDPYRWLEDGDDPAVRAWVDEQNGATRGALDAVPARTVWHARLADFLRLPVVQAVQVRSDRLVLLERDGGANQSRLVVRPLLRPASSCVVIADPASDSDDGAIAVDWFEASNDGELVAFGISEGGTENSVLHVARCGDGGWLDLAIPNCRASSVAWDADGTGFHYTRYPDGDQYHRTVHHHTLGTCPADDPVVWADHPTPETWPSVTASPDGHYLLLSAMVGWSRTDLHLLELATGTWTSIIEGVEAATSLRFDGDRLLGSTTLDAPRGRIVSAPLDDPTRWTTLVPERDVVIGEPHPIGDGFLVTTSSVGVDALERWSPDGVDVTVLAGVGTSTIVQVATDASTGAAVALVTGFDAPPTLASVGERSIVRCYPDRATDVVPDLAVSQVEYPSADGTHINLFLVHARGCEPDPSTATILTGYGGFSITESPVWSPMIAAWCSAGGQYAIAGLRGGFEHGEAWHDAGKRGNKQNVFDDFHAAADWLVATGRTSRDRLAIAGGSNGGLLVGAALTQRPDLCRAVWCAVPLLDMVRFPQFLIARLWTDEYGDPDVAEEFGWLWSYSPYHRVRDGERYPAVLLTTAEGDTRVDPLHARKMAAALQYAAVDQDDRPVLLHQEGRAGHGVGKPVSKRAAEQSDVLAFFSWQLGLEP